ncbi:Biopolymer transport protein ExbB [Pararobbsia alpina]|uniref:MotA/TolQ/ExbB proton channel family protein n=1 Tax=Pararobbsia alpina TaxID=621374 RepID=UPI0039A70183
MGETGVIHYLRTGDAVTQAVAWLLLAMSLLSWCFLLVKAWIVVRARRHAPRAIAVFWQAPTLSDGVSAMRRDDTERVFTPLAEAALHSLEADVPGALLARVDRGDRVMRSLRQALQRSQRRLEFGQVLLASIGSTAPFIGLLGTVWGIYHALGRIAQSGQASIDSVAGPVGETLIMTAFGLVVAIPAVLAYNILGRQVRQLGEDLDGFARDLHAFALAPASPAAAMRAPGVAAAPREPGTSRAARV